MHPLLPSEIERLWPLLPHPPGTFIRWFARKGNDRIGGGVDTVEELVLAAYSAVGMNFYVAPNPSETRAGTRHRANAVTHWSYFLVDIDPVEDLAEPSVVVENVLGLLGSWWDIPFDLRRPITIDSGRGMQVWIRLNDVLLGGNFGQLGDSYGGKPLVPHRIARITNGYWLRRLADEVGTLKGCRIDTTCADLPRVMRCPGTVNTKTGQSARLIVPSVEVYAGLAQHLVAAVPPEQFVPVPVPTLPADTSWQNVFVHLTLRAQDYLMKGKDEPGRHDTMFHVALCLGERGLDRVEVRRALQWGNERWDARHPGANMALQPEDIEHALDTAFRRLQRAGQSATLEVPVESPTSPLQEEV